MGWTPKWNIETALKKIVDWTRVYVDKGDVKEITLKQIREFEKTENRY
jgi:CDP-glucose 4,6-dehydratase